jgi:hypothetical protein
MKSFVNSLFAVAVILIAAQCQNQESPVAVDESSWNALVLAATQEQIDQALEIEDMMRELFNSTDENTAINRFCEAANLYVRGDVTTAHKKLFNLIRFEISKYRGGQAECGQSLECREKLADLLNAEFDFFGIDHDPVSARAFELDGGAGTCGPAGCLILTGTKFAGVRIPPGALSSTVFIFIERLPDTSEPLNIGAEFQFPLYFFIGSDPDVELTTDADVALCVLDNPPFSIGAPPETELRIAHNVGESGIEILPLGPSDFIDCTNAAPMAFHSPVWDTFLGRLVGPLTPRLLYAIPGELGSKASNFSPFGAVDIEGGEIATETTLDAEPNTLFVGDQITLTATVSPPPFTAESPVVEFFEDFGETRSSLGTATVNSDGVAVLVIDTSFECGVPACIGVGTRTLVAEFLGTDSFAPSTSNTEEVFVDFIS